MLIYFEKLWVPNPLYFDILTTRPAGASRWWKKSRHLGHPTTNRLPQGDVQLMSSLRSSQISTFPLSHWEMNLAAQGFTNGHLVGFAESWELFCEISKRYQLMVVMMMLLLMEDILHQFIGTASRSLQPFFDCSFLKTTRCSLSSWLILLWICVIVPWMIHHYMNIPLKNELTWMNNLIPN